MELKFFPNTFFFLFYCIGYRVNGGVLFLSVIEIYYFAPK